MSRKRWPHWQGSSSVFCKSSQPCYTCWADAMDLPHHAIILVDRSNTKKEWRKWALRWCCWKGAIPVTLCHPCCTLPALLHFAKPVTLCQSYSSSAVFVTSTNKPHVTTQICVAEVFEAPGATAKTVVAAACAGCHWHSVILMEMYLL